jgi:hypothetical protein
VVALSTTLKVAFPFWQITLFAGCVVIEGEPVTVIGMIEETEHPVASVEVSVKFCTPGASPETVKLPVLLLAPVDAF